MNMNKLFDDIKEPIITTPKKKRKKQKLEGLFSLSLKNTPGLLYHKLQVNQLAHQTMHCDFEVFNKGGHVFFIEAKEVQLKDGKGIFPFSRLTQRQALVHYDAFSDYTNSYLLLLFRGNTMANSFTYLIPIINWVNFENSIGKKSANVTDVYEEFEEYLISYSNNLLDLSVLL